VTQPERPRWKTLIPEGADTLEAVKLINDQFVAIYLQDAHELL
jgi:prolyl oligopeptidase PreP (S9A serine peptidase family)